MNEKGLVLLLLCTNVFVCAMNHEQHDMENVNEDWVYEAMENAKGDSAAIGSILHIAAMRCSASVEKEAEHNFYMPAVFEECCIIKKWAIPQIVDKEQKEIDHMRESGEWQKAAQRQKALDAYLKSDKYEEMKKKEGARAKL